jgi:hypothetical protein
LVILTFSVHKRRLSGGDKKFVVCMGEENTNEDKRCKTSRGGEGSDLSIQMLQDVLYEHPLCSKEIKTSKHFYKVYSISISFDSNKRGEGGMEVKGRLGVLRITE